MTLEEFGAFVRDPCTKIIVRNGYSSDLLLFMKMFRDEPVVFIEFGSASLKLPGKVLDEVRDYLIARSPLETKTVVVPDIVNGKATRDIKKGDDVVLPAFEGNPDDCAFNSKKNTEVHADPNE